MTCRRTRAVWILQTVLLALWAVSQFRADEGIWTLDRVPKARIKQRHGFEPSDVLLEHLRLASVRFNNGGSGSFVSPNGLVMTNHHIAADCVQKLSSQEKDYQGRGFTAANRDAEGKCPDLELNVLTAMQDVTPQVNNAVRPEMNSAQSFAAQRAAMSALEKQCAAATGLRCDVVTLYQGGVYSLYKYKTYTDVRVVFTPEFDAAFFGGDPDNFTYPRYNLDMAFVRVYENGKPGSNPHFLKWSRNGPKEKELVFVTGHPGSTNRMNTVARLEYLRDKGYPFTLEHLRRHLGVLQRFSTQGDDNARIARDEIQSVQNNLKAIGGELEGLREASLMQRKQAAERELRESVEKDPVKKAAYGGAWDEIAKVQAQLAQFYLERVLLEGAVAFDSRLFEIARTLVRRAAEQQKPNGERLREYTDSKLPSLELDLFSPAPIHESLEKATLGDSLSLLIEQLGPNHKATQKALEDWNPQQLADELVSQTRLKDVLVRKQLAEGGWQAIQASADPMIGLSLRVDDDARAVRRRYEDNVQGVERVNYALIAKSLFALKGTAVYPDATFTLRLSFGQPLSYSDHATNVPWFTRFAGLYERASQFGQKPPCRLPQRWMAGKSKLNLSKPLNFVLTADITGGNSGSPAVNRAGEIVGLIFDGNLPSLVWTFQYDAQRGRAIAVHSEGMIEALKSLYQARELLAELGR
ncbi:MAG: S46 family peptidase [Acidobacteria bacterium]|nr:S46 family peptidase [Acidobacteriota bacterium]